MPLHEGAQAYYDREKPDFWAATSDLMALYLSSETLLASWLWQLLSRFLQKQKNQAHQFKLAILNLIQKVRQHKKMEEIDLLQEELFENFKQVIVDLDEYRIDSDSFQSFSWLFRTCGDNFI
ncbi:hypothetical protein QUA40_09610 [Microcoleus sp. Pol11C3]|uniref:hypothetical protein n=1 Tax=Microcoleus sp. Pol11C3 TaxID=3055390 RepID=UPI002FCF5CCC